MSNSVTPFVYPVSGASNFYIATATGLKSVMEDFISANSNWFSGLATLFTDPNQYLISCRLWSIGFTNFINDMTIINSSVWIGDGKKISSTKLGRIASNPYLNFKVAEYTFTRSYNSFLDYDPYTRIQIYLPYSDQGFYDLDLDTYMGKKLEIYLDVDLTSGTCLYQLKIGTNVIETHNAKMCVDIPISQTNASELVRNNLLLGLNYGSRLALGEGEFNPIGMGLSMASDLISANQHKFHKDAQSSGFLDFAKPQGVFLIKSTPKVVYPTDYDHTFGKPSGKYCRLGDLNGYTEVGVVHLTNFPNATKQEIEEIEALLKSGVIL